MCSSQTRLNLKNTKNLETNVKKSGDFSKNLGIDVTQSQVNTGSLLLRESVFFPACSSLKTCVDLDNTEINLLHSFNTLYSLY